MTTGTFTTSCRSMLFLLPFLLPHVCVGFTTIPPTTFVRNIEQKGTLLFLAKKQSKATEESAAVAAILEQEETPAGVAGSEFFGGNRQKEELFDADAENDAESIIADTAGVYERYLDSKAFPNEFCKRVAMSLQHQINVALYEDETQDLGNEPDFAYSYASNLEWTTPFAIDKTSRTPLDEIEKALEFYNRVDVAIVSCEQTSVSQVKAQWEISVTWPNFWESHVLVTGSSILTINGDSKTITKQVDTLDNEDLMNNLGSQVVPRFWDTYHIFMSRSAELTPRLVSEAKKGLFRSYEIFEIPPRLVLKPSLDDVGSREEGYAQVIPNHAFSTAIKTMGPRRQRYIATSPVEVQISRVAGSDNPRITWTIPLAVELVSNSQLQLAGNDPETSQEASPQVQYEFASRRRVATVPFGGLPQDLEVANVRKQLYQEVVKDGHSPKLDETSGRPQFFFFQNDAKACFTEGGLGMAVYDWRPQFAKANEVGIELELN